METEDLDFGDLMNPDEWLDYNTYLQIGYKKMQEDLIKASLKEMELQKSIRKSIEKNRRLEIKKVSPEQIKQAKDVLYTGRSAAIDGTLSIFTMLGGMRCQIGVASVSYKNEKFEEVIYISEKEYEIPATDVINSLKRRAYDDSQRINGMVLRTIMMYQERLVALKRKEEYKILQGQLLPFELRSGCGRYKMLDTCLPLLSGLVENKKIFGVIENSTRKDLLTLGCALENGEYLNCGSLKGDLRTFNEHSKISKDNTRKMDEFINKYGDSICVGVYKVGDKPFIFESHVDNFDMAASLLIADSMHQGFRGFPLIVDYADSICAKLLSTLEFKNRIMWQLAKLNMLGAEISERDTRRR